eukprot:TRINITY_DN2044_c0_g1_i1.p4 TRINITY_DN2044_c0_g1~~TRINITY_DN2044_c0_g1_i1.p4  ORF type:complete len:123 (+),score=54.69 TRINITY_DN2044_c0_g1_i1:836-1204(+)
MEQADLEGASDDEDWHDGPDGDNGDEAEELDQLEYDDEPGGSGPRETQEYLPVSVITRVMKSVLPENRSKFSKEAKLMIQEIVTEFICYISGEVAHRTQDRRQPVITVDDILEQMADNSLVD